MLRVAAVLFGVALYIYFILDVLRTPRGETRNLPKAVWFLVVVLVPLLGGLAWLVLGRVWPAAGSRWGRRKVPPAPEDDPRYMKHIGDAAWSKRMQQRRGQDDTP